MVTFFRLVAHEMAAMHCIDAEKITGKQFNKEPMIWWQGQMFLDEIPKQYTNPKINKR